MENSVLEKIILSREEVRQMLSDTPGYCGAIKCAKKAFCEKEVESLLRRMLGHDDTSTSAGYILEKFGFSSMKVDSGFEIAPFFFIVGSIEGFSEAQIWETYYNHLHEMVEKKISELIESNSDYDLEYHGGYGNDDDTLSQAVAIKLLRDALVASPYLQNPTWLEKAIRVHNLFLRAVKLLAGPMYPLDSSSSNSQIISLAEGKAAKEIEAARLIVFLLAIEGKG